MPEAIKLIQPAPVERDEYGMFQHPDLPDFDERDGDGQKCKAWVAQQGLQLVMFHLETDAPDEIVDRYFASNDAALRLLGAWQARWRWLVLSGHPRRR